MSLVDRLLAEAVLEEGRPKRMRVRKAGQGGKRVIKKCPPGQVQKAGKCIRKSGSAKAKSRRQKRRWARSGGGKRSAKKSLRLRKRFDHFEHLGQLITEARAVLQEGPEHTRQEILARGEAWVAEFQAHMDKKNTDRTVKGRTFTFEPSQKYARVVGAYSQNSRSALCWIDLSNGDLLKSASWKAPVKGARGNIFDPSFPSWLGDRVA